jgi:hypothetical protein
MRVGGIIGRIGTTLPAATTKSLGERIENQIIIQQTKSKFNISVLIFLNSNNQLPTCRETRFGKLVHPIIAKQLAHGNVELDVRRDIDEQARIHIMTGLLVMPIKGVPFQKSPDVLKEMVQARDRRVERIGRGANGNKRRNPIHVLHRKLRRREIIPPKLVLHVNVPAYAPALHKVKVGL